MASRLVAPLLIFVVLLVPACGGDDDEEGRDTAALTTQAATPPPAAADPRCQAADTSLMTPLANRLTAEGARLNFGRYVESQEVDGIFFVSAEIDGGEFDGRGDIATWATESQFGGGAIYAINDLAKEHTTWPPGEEADPPLSAEQQGAELSQDCVRAAVPR